MKIGERILKLRKKANLSQEEVAAQLNVTRQTISKWETGESTPDFDKILPLCNLFDISTDELIKGEKKDTEYNSETSQENRKAYKKKTAKILSISIFLYFISIIWIIALEPLQIMKDELLICGFLFICAIPTCMIVYHFVSNSNTEKEKKSKNPIYKRTDEIISLFFCALYFLVSFITMRWDVTWIIWIIYSIFIEISHLLIDMKRGEKDE